MSLHAAEGVDPLEQWVDVSGLDPDFALTVEAADEAFAAEEEVFDGFGGAGAAEDLHLILEGVFKPNDVSRIDQQAVADIKFDDGAVRVEEDVTGSGGFDEDQSFAAEETFCSLPFSADFNTFGMGKERAALEVKGTAVEVMMADIAGDAWCECDFAGSGVCAVGAGDEAFSGEDASEGFAEAGFESGFEGEVWRHGGHG